MTATINQSTPKVFHTPILTTLYNLLGGLIIAAGVLGAVVVTITGIGGLVSERSALAMGGSFAVAIVILLIAAIIALPFFGIAQVIQYIGKTAYYAEVLNNNLTSESYEIRKLLGGISDGVKKVAYNQDDLPEFKRPVPLPHVPQAASIAPTINCPHCNQRIFESSLVNGMNTCPKCSGTFKVEI